MSAARALMASSTCSNTASCSGVTSFNISARTVWAASSSCCSMSAPLSVMCSTLARLSLLSSTRVMRLFFSSQTIALEQVEISRFRNALIWVRVQPLPSSSIVLSTSQCGRFIQVNLMESSITLCHKRLVTSRWIPNGRGRCGFILIDQPYYLHLQINWHSQAISARKLRCIC